MVSDILTLSIAIQGINNFSTTFRQARAEISGLQGTLRAIGAGIREAAGAAIMITAMMAQEFVKSSLEVARQFEISMVRVGAIAGATGSQFDMLVNKVTELGRTTMFTRQEVSEGAKQMAMAGLNAEQITASLGAVVAISEVLGLEIGRVAEVATDLGLAFQMNIASANVMTSIVDEMTATVTSAALSFEQYAQSMTYVSATASTIGMEMHEISSALAIMANMGIKGSKAGTSLNRALQSIIAPTGKTIAVMQKLGLQFNQNILETEGLIGIVKQLTEAGATAADMLEMFGIRGGRSMLAMVNAGATALEEMDETIKNSEGITEELQERIHETAEFTYKEFAASVEVAKGKLGEWLNNGIVPLMKGLMTLGEVFANHRNAFRILAVILAIVIIKYKFLNREHMKAVVLKNIDTVATFNNAAAHGTLWKYVMLCAHAFKALGVAMLTNPITMAMVAIMALVTALAFFDRASKSARNSVFDWRNTQYELNNELEDEHFLVVRTRNDVGELSDVYARYSDILKGQLDLLEEAGLGQSVVAGTIRETTEAIENATNKIDYHANALERALIAGQEYNGMSDEQIGTLKMMETLWFGLSKSFQYAGASVHELMTRLTNASNKMFEYRDIIDDANEKISAYKREIEFLEQTLEAVEYEHDELRKSIRDLNFAIEDLNDTLKVNKTRLDSLNASMAVYDLEMEKAREAFEDVTWKQFGEEIWNLDYSITYLTNNISRYSSEIKYNEMIIEKSERAAAKIAASFVKERQEIDQVTQSIRRMSESMDRLSFAQTENSIRIRKIQLAARKEGRELNQEELDLIEEMEIANEEKAIKSMELGQLEITAEKDRAKMQKDLDKQIIDATAEHTKIITDLSEWNEHLKDLQLQADIDLVESNSEKNKLLRAEDESYIDFMRDNYSELTGIIATTRYAIQDLSEDEIYLKAEIAKVNVPLIEQETTLAGLIRDQEQSIADTVDFYEDLIETYESKMPGWLKAWEDSKQLFIDINKELAVTENTINRILDLLAEEITPETPSIKEVLRKSFEETIPGAKTSVGQTVLDWVGLQHGGVVNKPTAAIIGEAGPEQVTPLKKTQPYDGSMGSTTGAGGGTTVHIESINFIVNELADFQNPEKRKKIVSDFIKELRSQMRR